jgi:short-subunit dehydrogenase
VYSKDPVVETGNLKIDGEKTFVILINMKNILITGASGNLGKVVTAEFISGDYHLNLVVHKQVENSERQTFWYPDLTDIAQVRQMMSSLEQSGVVIDTVIHLVGGYKPGTLNETHSTDVTEMVTLNFNTAFNVVDAFLPHFTANSGGRFVFIGARAAMRPETAGNNVAYALSKQMLLPFAEMINHHGTDKDIAAHVLLPATLDTALNRSLMPDADFSAWTSTEVLAKTIKGVVKRTEPRMLIEF